jgi:hypothetical protein
MIRHLLIFAMLMFIHATSVGGNGSNYTIFALGDIRALGSPRNAGMGYAGIAVSDGRNIHTGSPATWSSIPTTKAEGGLLFEGFNASDGQKSLFLSSTNFNGASLAFPISRKNGIVAVGSVLPYSNKDYNVYTFGSQQGIDYSLHHEGKGGIGQAQIGLSYAPLRVLALGASFNYLFGSLDNSRTFLPTSSLYAGGKTTSKTTAHGITATLGSLFSGFGEIFPWLQPLSLGVVITSRGILDADGLFEYTFENEVDSLTVTVDDLIVPVSYGIGLSYQAGERWLIATDLFSQLWKHSSFPRITRNSTRLGFGVEHLPAREFSSPWLSRIAYRFGSYYHQTYYLVNGEGIDEWGITAGLGVPVSGETRVHLAFEYGQRGSTANNLIRESILRFSASMFISELWFTSFEEE